MAEPSTMNSEKNCNYLHYIELPLKLVACWEWFPKPTTWKQVITNNIYLCLVLSALVRFAVGLSVHIYTEWTNIMSCLHEIADSLPLLVSIIIVSYYAVYRDDLYELIAFINANFKHHSAQGLTNMTMNKSYQSAAKFARIYTACSMFSVTMYSTLPVFATCKYKKRRSITKEHGTKLGRLRRVGCHMGCSTRLIPFLQTNSRYLRRVSLAASPTGAVPFVTWILLGGTPHQQQQRIVWPFPLSAMLLCFRVGFSLDQKPHPRLVLCGCHTEAAPHIFVPAIIGHAMVRGIGYGTVW